LSKITDLMKRALFVSSVTGVMFIGATATAHASVPAAQAQTTGTSTDVPDTAQNQDPVTPQSTGDCIDYLETWGYQITRGRRLACSAAAFPFPSQPVRIATCTAALISTGVGGVVAPIACTLATAP
jgi:hypothetical protein